MTLVSVQNLWFAAPENHNLLPGLPYVDDGIRPIRKLTLGVNEQPWIEFENGQIAFSGVSTAGIDLDALLAKGYIDQAWYDRALELDREKRRKALELEELKKEKEAQKYYLERLWELERCIQAVINAAPGDKDTQERFSELLSEIRERANSVQDAFDEKFPSD